MVKTICEQCGDRGFSVALIYCDKCQIAAVHRYCLPVMPEDFEEDVIWYCVDCEHQFAKLSSEDNLNSLLAWNCDSRNLEIVQETQSEKNDVNRLKRRDCIDSLDKAEVHQGEISPCSHLELHCNENHEQDKDEKFRKQRELDGSSSNEEAKSVKTKTPEIVIGDGKNNIEHSSELHCIEGDKNDKNLERQDCFDSLAKAEVCQGEISPCSHLELHCNENHEKDKDEKFRRHRELDGSSSNEEAKSVKTKTPVMVIGDCNNNIEHSSEVHCSEGDKNNKNLERQGCIDSLAKVEVRKGGISPCSHPELHCNENHKKNKDEKFRRQIELDGSGSNEEAESMKTITPVIAIADCKNNIDHSSELHCSEGDKNNENLERQIEWDGSSSHKEIESVKGKTPSLVTNSPTDIKQHCCYDHKRPIIEVRCSENDRGDNNFKRQKVPIRDISDEGIESVEPKNSPVASINSLNIPKSSFNAHAESTTIVHCNQNDGNVQRTRRQKGIEQGYANEEAKSAKHETSLVLTSVPSNINRSVYVPAQPIFQPIWNGSLYLSNVKYGTVGGLAAHLSTMASSRVFEEAKKFPELLCLELLPRFDVWPHNFNKGGPSDDNIALYLFPMNDRDEKVYDSLVDDMISHKLAMRAVLENAELLVFTSNVLPYQFWRFESKFYLWGVFRGKQVSHVQATQLAWYPQSPVSVLNHSEKNGINRLKKKLQSRDYIGSQAEAEFGQGEISPSEQLEFLFSNSQQGWQARREVIDAFMKLKMKAGECVKDFTMKVIDYLNEARLLGARIDRQTQMDMIVNKLSDSFAEFKINYELNKKEYTLTGLMHDLQVAEKILLKKKHDESTIVNAPFVGTTPKSFKKGKQKEQKGKKKGNLAPTKDTKKKAKKEAKIGKCFHCGVRGHWKRDCRVYLAEK